MRTPLSCLRRWPLAAATAVGVDVARRAAVRVRATQLVRCTSQRHPAGRLRADPAAPLSWRASALQAEIEVESLKRKVSLLEHQLETAEARAADLRYGVARRRGGYDCAGVAY